MPEDLDREVANDFKETFKDVQQFVLFLKGLLPDNKKKDKQKKARRNKGKMKLHRRVESSDNPRTYHYEQGKSNKTALAPTEKDSLLSNPSFEFSGKQTDLCYFSFCDRMPLEKVHQIADEKVKNAVLDNFQKALDAGLITTKDGMIKITNKGKGYIKDENFIKAAYDDQCKIFNKSIDNCLSQEFCKDGEQLMGVELTGNRLDDLTYFTISDRMSLFTVQNNPCSKLSQRILNNVAAWQQKGIVVVKEDEVSLTSRGKKYIQSDNFKQKAKNLKEKPFSELKSNGVLAITRKADTSQTLQKTAQLKPTLKKGL